MLWSVRLDVRKPVLRPSEGFSMVLHHSISSSPYVDSTRTLMSWFHLGDLHISIFILFIYMPWQIYMRVSSIVSHDISLSPWSIFCVLISYCSSPRKIGMIMFWFLSFRIYLIKRNDILCLFLDNTRMYPGFWMSLLPLYLDISRSPCV